MTFNCPTCNQVGFHQCLNCGKEIVFADCEYNNGLCDECFIKNNNNAYDEGDSQMD